VGADYGAIDNRAGLIDLDLELPKYRRPVILRCPIRKPVVDRLPAPESLRKVTPRNPRPDPKKDGFDEQSIAARRMPSLRSSGKQRLKPLPLLVGESVTVHEQL
jgi:hypothetical protein